MNSDDIRNILKKYGGGLQETRELIAEVNRHLATAVAPESLLTGPAVLGPEEAADLGIELDEGWQLKVTPDSSQRGFSVSYVTPESWEITDLGEYISPEGQVYTEAELRSLGGEQEPILTGFFEGPEPAAIPTEGWLAEPTTAMPAEVQEAFTAVFPETDLITLLEYAEQQPEAFYTDIVAEGRSAETEALLRAMYPEISEADLQEIFAPYAVQTAQWHKLTEQRPAWAAAAPPPLDLGAAAAMVLGHLGGFLEKYIDRPYETAAMEVLMRSVVSQAQYDIRAPEYVGQAKDAEKILSVLEENRQKYGVLGSFFSDEANNAWETVAREEAGLGGMVTLLPWTNPAYTIPIGSSFGLAARWTTKVPILGKALEYTAAGVQAIEAGVVKPVAVAAQAAVKGLNRVGVELGEQAAKQLIKRSRNLEALLDLPTTEAIIEAALVDNWMKRTLQVAAKIKPIRLGIEKSLGWRILVKREGQLIEDIVGQAAVAHSEVLRRGINARAVKYWELQSIVDDPIKYFGFNEDAISQKMIDRLLPEYRGLPEAGTLEHVFTKPEMYNWTGMERGLEYVTRVHEVNNQVLTLLRNEGVPPEGILEDWWIHRVVEGKFDANGELVRVRGRTGGARGRIGARLSYELRRKAPTMAEGIAWGIKYNRSPQVSVGSYIEQAFKKIADERFVKYVSESLAAIKEPFGLTPSELLARRYPQLLEEVETAAGRQLVQKAVLRADELQHVNHFASAIQRAIRGEKLPSSTLRAIERRFPGLGNRFRNLVQTQSVGETQLREVIAKNQRLVDSLYRQLEKAKALDISAIELKAREKAMADLRTLSRDRPALPPRDKLTEAFWLMEEEDRRAFRLTMQDQGAEIQEIIEKYSAELGALDDFLSTDLVAQFRGTMGKRRMSLTSILTKEGEWPETLTRKQAEVIMLGREVKPSSLTPEGRVKWEYVLDELADEFNMSEQELIEAIEHIRLAKNQQRDFQMLLRDAENREKRLRYMLDVLDDADAGPRARVAVDTVEGTPAVPTEATEPLIQPKPAEAIPKAEAGELEAGVQKDIFGYETPVYPKGKAEVTQMSMDDLSKLEQWRKDAGLPPPEVAVKPEIEGIPSVEAEALKPAPVKRVAYEIPPESKGINEVVGYTTHTYERQAYTYQRGGKTISVPAKTITTKKPVTAGEQLLEEVNAVVTARKGAYWQARAERKIAMEKVRRPEIGKGYIMQPFAGGKIFDQEFIDAFNKFFGWDKGLGVLRATSDVAGIMRITKAALDLSMMAIQGMPAWGLAHAYLLIDPKIGAELTGAWYRAFLHSCESFFHPSTLASFMAKNEEIALQRIAMGGSSRAVDYFATLEARTGLGGWAEKAMAKIPLKPYHRAEIAFYGAGEMVRNEFWRILSPKAIKSGQEFELARFLDRITGIIDPATIGVPLTVRQLEQTFGWFAPAYTRACLTVVADIFRGGYTGHMARRAIGGMIGAGAMYFAGVQFSAALLEGKSAEQAWNTVLEGFGLTQDPITGTWEWRPTGAFMTMKVGNYRFGFGGFWYGLLRLAGNISACVNEVGGKERIDLVRLLKYGSFNKKDNPFIYWWYSRSSPLVGFGFDLASGQDFLGYPIETPMDYAQYILTRFEPIWMEQGLNPLIPGLGRDHEVPEGAARAAVIPAEIFGLRTFPESGWVKFYDKALEYIGRMPATELDEKQMAAWREGTLGWNQLSEIQRTRLLTRYPDLNELYEEAQADSAVRSSPQWAAWSKRVDEERATYYERINDLTDLLIRGEINTQEYREKAGEAGSNYYAIMAALERDPAYADIYDYFAKKEAEGDKYGFKDDIALAEYQSYIQFAEVVDEHGDPDWDERDRRVDEFIEEWGEDVYQRIQQYLQDERKLKGLNEVWVRRSKDSEALGRAYWRLPYKPVIEMDDEDLADGAIPGEYVDLWNAYQRLETDEEREAFLRTYPDMAKNWRQDYRREHPEDDARLALWGYGGKLQSMRAYELVVQWAEELGLSLDNLGLGLPPKSLIGNYFEYNDIVAQYGGSSVEAKWYRLEHEKWEAWGQEHYGWTAISQQGVMPRNVYSQYQEYQSKPKGQARLVYRHEHPELERYLVEEKGYTPVGDRWKTGEGGGGGSQAETPWTELEEIEEFKELFE